MARRYWVRINGRKHFIPGTLADVRRAARNAADNLGQIVQAGYDEKPAKRRRATLRRNPVMRGHDYTGEEWLTVGYGPRGRMEMRSGSRQEADNDARYMHSLGFRAMTTRRTSAPMTPKRPGKRQEAVRGSGAIW